MQNQTQQQNSSEVFPSITVAGFDSSGTSSGQIEGVAGTTVMFNQWNAPWLVRTEVFGGRIELTYKETSNLSIGWQGHQTRVFKQVYSCVDGQWNVSDRIYGEIIPASAEEYDFGTVTQNA